MAAHIVQKPTPSVVVGQTIRSVRGKGYFVSDLIQERPNYPYKVFLAKWVVPWAWILRHSLTEASSDNSRVVLKTVSSRQFETAQKICGLLRESSVLRLPLDMVKEPNAIIYEYFDENLQSLTKRADFTREQIKHISRLALEAIAEIHDIDYLHGGEPHYKLQLNIFSVGIWKADNQWPVLDVKAENIMVNYNFDEAGKITIKKVYLIDSESAYPVKDGEYADGLIVGHHFWRSPEALVSRMLGKPTDIFSFGLVVSLVPFRVSCSHLTVES
jgi:serine/threonine protein kinase